MSPTGCWFNAPAAAALADVERAPTTAAADSPSRGTAAVHRMQVQSTDTLPGGMTAKPKVEKGTLVRSRRERRRRKISTVRLRAPFLWLQQILLR